MSNKEVKKGELAEGEAKEELQSVLSEKFNRKYVQLVSNGFSSIFLSLKAIKGEYKKVLTSPIGTCFAMINAIKANDLIPHLSDIDSKTMSNDFQKAIIEGSEFESAVIPNHFGIQGEINRKGIADKFLIEDAAQSFSTSYKRKNKSDITILSFYPTKIVNGIDGGAILTDDEDVFKYINRIVSYDDQFNAEHEARYNFKMSNINAAHTLGSLDHLPSIEEKMAHNFERIANALQEKKVNVISGNEGDFKTKVLIKCDSIQSRNLLVTHFSESDIETSYELNWLCDDSHRSKYPNAKECVETTFSIPFHPFLKDQEIEIILKSIKSI